MKLKIFLILISTGLFFSCQKDRLEPLPQTQIVDELAFATPERALQQINGLYSGLKAGNFFAGRYQVYQDVRGEEFLNQTQNGVTAFQTWNFTVSPTTNEVQNLWTAGYAAINRVNVVLQGLPTAPITPELLKQYIAEAKFVRAFAYFAMLQMYARPYTSDNGASPGIPLRLQAEIALGGNEIARSTVAEVYTQILKDLNEAEVDLPASYAGANAAATELLNSTRAHKNTAAAFKTRVYLTMGRYADVITEGNKVVPAAPPYVAPSGWGNTLMPSIATVFTSPYTTKESILNFPFQPLDLPGTQNSLGSYYNPGPNGAGDFSLNTTGNGIVANTGWTAADARRAFNITAANTRTYLRKWPNNAGSNPDAVQAMRYSEIMLNIAEASARLGTDVDARALELLNAVRKRSDPATTLAPATKQELIDAILLERRIELLGEGFRTQDVTRTGAAFAAKGTIPAYPSSSNLYIWPISNGEMITNKSMTQNPGY